jgi:hypothetical protein
LLPIELLYELQVFLKDLNFEWLVCGGHAIDLFVGRETRGHKDLDIALFQEQRALAVKYLLEKGWRVFEPDSGALYEITHLNADKQLKSNLWCMTRNNTNYKLSSLGSNRFNVKQLNKEQKKLDYIELLFNTHEDGFFIYRRNPNILRSLALYKMAYAGIPFLSPEIVLLYKSSFVQKLTQGTPEQPQTYIQDYRHDFSVCLPLMDDEQKQWLKKALETEYMDGHEWLQSL